MGSILCKLHWQKYVDMYMWIKYVLLELNLLTLLAQGITTSFSAFWVGFFLLRLWCLQKKFLWISSYCQILDSIFWSAFSIRTGFIFLFGTDWSYTSLIWIMHCKMWVKKVHSILFTSQNKAELNEVYDQSVPKRNTKPALIERKQAKDWIQ